MTQADRDRLVTLQKTRKGLITQGEAAGELDLSLRQVQRLLARFVRHDSTEENMRLLWSYLEKHGRPLAFYTDKASLFQTAEKHKRDEPGLDCGAFCTTQGAAGTSRVTRTSQNPGPKGTFLLCLDNTCPDRCLQDADVF